MMFLLLAIALLSTLSNADGLCYETENLVTSWKLGCEGSFTSAPKSYNSEIYVLTTGDGQCWMYFDHRNGNGRYRFIMREFTEAEGARFADPSSSDFGSGAFNLQVGSQLKESPCKSAQNVEFSVIIGEKNTNGCVEYMTAQECEDYANTENDMDWSRPSNFAIDQRPYSTSEKLTMESWESVGTWSNFPKGCFSYPHLKTISYNNHEAGKGNGNTKPVCMGEKKAIATGHYVVMGRPGAVCDEDVDCSTRVENDAGSNFGVRCCSSGVWRDNWHQTFKNDGCGVLGSSNPDGVCLQSNTWQGANDACAAVSGGGRLCTKQEVENMCVALTGCKLDFRPIWTSTEGPLVEISEPPTTVSPTSMRPTSQSEFQYAWVVKRGMSTDACDYPNGNCDSRRENKMENHPITCCSATGDHIGNHWRQRNWNPVVTPKCAVEFSVIIGEKNTNGCVEHMTAQECEDYACTENDMDWSRPSNFEIDQRPYSTSEKETMESWESVGTWSNFPKGCFSYPHLKTISYNNHEVGKGNGNTKPVCMGDKKECAVEFSVIIGEKNTNGCVEHMTAQECEDYACTENDMDWSRPSNFAIDQRPYSTSEKLTMESWESVGTWSNFPKGCFSYPHLKTISYNNHEVGKGNGNTKPVCMGEKKGRGIFCGSDQICIGAVDGNPACYGSSSACLWNQQDCSKDSDCVKYSQSSAKYVHDGNACKELTEGWGSEACSNNVPQGWFSRSTVESQGENVAGHGSDGQTTLQDCTDWCDSEPKCKSIVWRSAGDCWLKNVCVSENSPESPNPNTNGFKTYYKACPVCEGVWTESDIWDVSHEITAESRCLTGTWYDAERVCAENDGRLCTKNEIEAGCAEQTGCDFDRVLIWSQDEESQ